MDDKLSSEQYEEPQPSAASGIVEDVPLPIDINSLPYSINSEVFETIDFQKKREEVILQKNFDVVSKSMFGEVILNLTDTEEDFGENGNVVDCEDIKEIVETVKNVVLGFQNECESGNDNLPDCDSATNNCDIMKGREIVNFNILNNHSTNMDNAKSTESRDVTIHCDKFCGNRKAGSGETCNEEEGLKSFNSYNYWYVSPEMPLDPDIVRDGKCQFGDVPSVTDRVSSFLK